MAEEESLARGEGRIKFTCKWLGKLWKHVGTEKKKVTDVAQKLADLLLHEEKHGFAPMAPDGRIGGNGAVIVNIFKKEYVLVSKSGKLPGQMDPLNDFCLISNFNKEEWSCEYYSEQEGIKPTSDTPMHYFLLKTVKGAVAALHGHAIADEESAKALNVPISTEETLFSTPADTEAMFKLLKEYPYPESKIFVRKNHGFYILGKDLEECNQVLSERLIKTTTNCKPNRKRKRRSNTIDTKNLRRSKRSKD